MSDDLQMYIDGVWTDAIEGARTDVINPATAAVFATVPTAGQKDVEAAIAAARRTFDDGTWPGTSERERGRVLLRAAEIVRRERDRLAHLETQDAGKPLGEAGEDIDEVAFMLEYYGGWATKITGEIPPVGDEAMSLVVKEPAGVVAAITPWNYPMMMATQKVAAALAAGCTVVLKPASVTPLTALRLGAILEEAGLPAGVLNVVTGPGAVAGSVLATHPDVDVITLTGSTEVGKTVMRAGVDTLKRVCLELGGKSPNIVFADADFEAAVEGSCNGVFWNQGEICSSGSRVFIQRPIYDDALAAMAEHAQGIVLGDGLDADTTMGPLVSAQQRTMVERYIEIGEKEARLVAQGSRPDDPRLADGYFVPPTIFETTNQSTIAREEIFGPVMSVIPFDDPNEVIDLANDTEYGLAAAVWTQDITKALRTAKALRAGIVWVNDSQPAPTESPWGGYKQSGIGRELGSQGLDDFLEIKHIWVNLGND